MAQEKEKLKLLKDPLVIQIVFDALHRRRLKYSTTDNSGGYMEYKEMVEEVKNDYKKQIDKSIKN